MDAVQALHRAQDSFDAVLAAVGPDQWDAPSCCPGWTIRDVAGHVIWFQEQLRCWATGMPYDNRTGAPGADHPGEMAGPDPMPTWRSARDRARKALKAHSLDRPVRLGDDLVPLSAVVQRLAIDHTAHSWDIGYPIGLAVRLDPELLTASFPWARQFVVRRQSGFGAEIAVPPDADEQTRWLAFLGRGADSFRTGAGSVQT
ncbi:TIGR03086 family metal-binding protein [Kibdelosporangium persicum]|uniref:Mycothiol-dependent maleylpyruvate isomerase metal-binding domain-containing protein n=1 Tax=Kibdelosporangium persicum TaxID=2698649 RepID=A0ABX2F8W3_9PSEU|nr:TIGR03086 family metal-binding protein [Kibdelosporangium persicum]NRN67366.1 hypothetical protein [Kibdelosporangium persicum]